LRRRAVLALVLLLLAGAGPVRPAGGAQEAPPPMWSGAAGFEPLVRSRSQAASRAIPPALLARAEALYREGRLDEALSRFLDLAYNFPDDERKGFAWMRVGEILLARDDLKEALSAADGAIRLSRARYLALSAMNLKLRVYERARSRTEGGRFGPEARQLAAYLLEQGFTEAEPSRLYEVMARADASAGLAGRAISEFDRAAQAARTPIEAQRLSAERDSLVEGLSEIPAIRDAAESEGSLEVRGRLYYVLGRVAEKKGFPGMAAWALEKAARAGGPHGQEAAERLFRLERINAARPRIVGLVPLSGKLAETGFAVLSGAEVALRQARGDDLGRQGPVLRWTDTGGEPDRARRLFQEASSDRNVVGFIGPLTGEEGRSVGMAFGPKSPPVLYLGQKAIPDKPFLYSEAVNAAARETGVRVAKSVSYPPDLKDFTGVIKKTVGAAAFSRHARSKEKGKGMKLKQEGIVIADRWDRVFQMASQLRYYNVYLPLSGFSGWNDQRLIAKAGDAVAGAFFSIDYADAVPGSQGEKFRADFQEAMGSAPSRFEAMGYDGAFLLRDAFILEEPRDPSRSAGEAARSLIPRLKSFRGVTGQFQFGPAGDMKRRVFLLRVELGNFVPAPEN
jgi:ABC-type branched-subunit amino acid transport system substrate-binding protein